MSRELVILGAGGHARAVAAIALASSTPIKCFVDPGSTDAQMLDIPIAQNLPAGDLTAIVAVGDNALREKLADEWLGAWATLIHPRAWVGPNSQIGPGTVVGPNAVVHVNTMIGAHSIINTAATIDHDCRIGDFVHVAPGVSMCGGVTVEDHVLIGSGATITPGICIGEGAIIGAGATVLEDVPSRETWGGTPAKALW